jgi:hypothetical protein
MSSSHRQGDGSPQHRNAPRFYVHPFDGSVVPRTPEAVAANADFMYEITGGAGFYRALFPLVGRQDLPAVAKFAVTCRLNYMCLFLGDFINQFEETGLLGLPSHLMPLPLRQRYFRIVYMFDLPVSEIPRFRIHR